jgi:hypothetical protein
MATSRHCALPNHHKLAITEVFSLPPLCCSFNLSSVASSKSLKSQSAESWLAEQTKIFPSETFSQTFFIKEFFVAAENVLDAMGRNVR